MTSAIVPREFHPAADFRYSPGACRATEYFMFACAALPIERVVGDDAAAVGQRQGRVADDLRLCCDEPS